MPALHTPGRALDTLDPDEWLTAAEIGPLIGVTENTFRSWVRRGKGPTVYRMNGVLRFKAGDVQSWHDRFRYE